MTNARYLRGWVRIKLFNLWENSEDRESNIKCVKYYQNAKWLFYVNIFEKF